MNNVIAVVGPLASGKGALVTLLTEKGYHVLSLSNGVREKATAWGLTHTRENLQNVGDKLRKKFGPSILAELATVEIKNHPEGKYVIDGIRNPAELTYIMQHFHVFTIGVVASSQKRFKLMQGRKRAGDPTTWEKFEKAEERDRGIGQEDFGQQVEKCLKMANIVIDNNGTLEEFQTNLRYFLKNIL